MPDAWRAYLDLALGLTEAPRKKAQQVAGELLQRGGATAVQVQGIVEDLLSAGLANREALTSIVRYEVDRALGRVGLATAEEVSDLTAKVHDLERQLRQAQSRVDAAGPGVPEATTTRPVKKTVAKKAVKAKPNAMPAAGTDPAAVSVNTAVAPAVPPAPAPVKRAPAKRAPAKTAPAESAPVKRGPRKAAGPAAEAAGPVARRPRKAAGPVAEAGGPVARAPRKAAGPVAEAGGPVARRPRKAAGPAAEGAGSAAEGAGPAAVQPLFVEPVAAEPASAPVPAEKTVTKRAPAKKAVAEQTPAKQVAPRKAAGGRTPAKKAAQVPAQPTPASKAVSRTEGPEA